MSKKEILTNKALTIELYEEDVATNAINIKWIGRSTDSEPSIFITPILSNVFDNALTNKKQIIMDFSKLEYLNSSTITPISKFLEIGKNEGHSIKIIYDKTIKWQELSFSALKIFETNDQRIKIIGK